MPDLPYQSHERGDPVAASFTLDPVRFATFDAFNSRENAILLLACTNHSSPLLMPNAEQPASAFWTSLAREFLLDGLLVTSQGCGTNPPAPSTGAQALTLELSASQSLPESKTIPPSKTLEDLLLERENTRKRLFGP